jgi:hypothetical protein
MNIYNNTSNEIMLKDVFTSFQLGTYSMSTFSGFKRARGDVWINPTLLYSRYSEFRDIFVQVDREKRSQHRFSATISMVGLITINGNYVIHLVPHNFH